MKRHSWVYAMWLGIAVALVLATLVCTFLTGCTSVEAVSPAAAHAQVSGGILTVQEILIILDLSPSLTTEERLRISQDVAGMIQDAPPNSTVKVLLLETNMGNRRPLLDVTVPDAPTTGQQIEKLLWLQGVEEQLRNSVKEVLKWPAPKQRAVLTSCYVASGAFANDYFSHRAAGTNRRLVWLGDLIEDCPKAQFAGFRLPKAGAIRSLQSLHLGLQSLKSVEIEAVMVPRDLDDPEGEVPAGTIRDYWKELPPHLGLTAGAIKVGTSDELGIREIPFQ